MLSLDDITLQYGARKLFDRISANILPHDRIGLVGSNGSGKTTLLKIIAGELEPEAGRMVRAHYVSVGYLPQEGICARETTVFREAESAFEEVLGIREKLEEVRRELNESDPEDEKHGELLEIEGELQHRLEELDAFRMKSKIERVLVGLGFSTDDMDRPTAEFSGGWQMRLAMARLLLREPSLLLLDEPTNHLDIEAQDWLEHHLRHYDGALILVSHDRAFLDALCTRTFALSQGSIESYSGNYSFYERESVLRKENLRQARANQEKKLAQTQRFIDRFRAKATKASQVQSRIKQMEKVERIELEEEEENVSFHFPPPPKSARRVMELENLEKRYGDLTVFRNANLRIERGDRIAILGVNGAGKSTLARIIAGVDAPTAGLRAEGDGVRLSYFAQHQAEELDPAKTVFETAAESAPQESETRIRTILGAFLFKGNDVFKHVSVLSGGEKSRLALVRMLLDPGNLLVLDEPTNHLDMASKRVLQRALLDFPGTCIIVSHDRSFLDPLVVKVLEVSRSGLRLLPGNVSDYLRKREEERTHEDAAEMPHPHAGRANSPAEPRSPKERRQLEAQKRRDISRKLAPLRKRESELETKIFELEGKKEALESRMANPEFYGEAGRARTAAREYDQLKLDLQSAYADWNAVVEAIAAIEKP